MRFLPGLLLGVAVALAVTAEGCNDRACLEWNEMAEGSCPAQADALGFFGECSDVKKVLSAPTYLADEGGLCCYDVIHRPLASPIPCRVTTTTTTRMTGTGGTTSIPETGGAHPTSSSSETTTTTVFDAGACDSCAQVLAGGNNGDVCSGTATETFTQLVTCACGSQGACEASCHNFCGLGEKPSPSCHTCLGASCAAELAGCEAN
jgi:hypothetical protein